MCIHVWTNKWWFDSIWFEQVLCVNWLDEQLTTWDIPCRRRDVIWCRQTYCRGHSIVRRLVSDYFQTITLWIRRHQRSRSSRQDTSVERQFGPPSARPPQNYLTAHIVHSVNTVVTATCWYVHVTYYWYWYFIKNHATNVHAYNKNNTMQWQWHMKKLQRKKTPIDKNECLKALRLHCGSM